MKRIQGKLLPWWGSLPQPSRNSHQCWLVDTEASSQLQSLRCILDSSSQHSFRSSSIWLPSRMLLLSRIRQGQPALFLNHTILLTTSESLRICDPRCTDICGFLTNNVSKTGSWEMCLNRLNWPNRRMVALGRKLLRPYLPSFSKMHTSFILTRSTSTAQIMYAFHCLLLVSRDVLVTKLFSRRVISVLPIIKSMNLLAVLHTILPISFSFIPSTQQNSPTHTHTHPSHRPHHQDSDQIHYRSPQR
jgi:hypothetical protein